MLLHLMAEDSGNVQCMSVRCLQKGTAWVMLAQDKDRIFEGRDGLQGIFLLRIEFSELFGPQCRCSVKRFLILSNFRFQVLNLCVQTGTRSCKLLDLRCEICNVGLCISDGLCLFLVICLTPAGKILIDLFVLLSFLLQ